MKTREDIVTMQGRLLHEAVAYAYDRSPYYRETLSAAHVTPAAIQSVRDIVKIPITTKADFSSRSRDFLCVPRESVVDITTTSGTSGLPVMVNLTAQDVERLAHNEALAFEQAGLTAQDTVVLAVTMDRCFMAGMAYWRGLQRIGAAVVRVGSGSPAMLLKMIERTGATGMITVPSFLKRITAYARDNGVSPADLGVRTVVCIGEPVRDRAMQLNTLSARLSRDWQAGMFSTYGSTEIQGSFCECTAGCGGHVQPEHMFAEILLPDGTPAAPGQVGELCVTTFGVSGMPVLRYRTGDETFMLTEPCACGRVTPRIGPILGRRDQMLKVKGTTIFPNIIHDLVQSHPGVQAHVLVVESEDPLSDKLTLLVDAEQAEVLEDLREAIRSELKVVPEIRSLPAKEIQAMQTAGDYRKRRVLIDKRRPA